VICTHNGSAKLERTIEHLKQQQTSRDLKWEVLLVDNASNDHSGAYATTCWGKGPAPMRVVLEPNLGEWNARLRGLKEARHDIIGFVDDDNWVAPNWVQRLSEIMTNDPTIGLCGSLLSPIFQEPPPSWFERFQIYYAIVTAEYASQARPAVCAAGMGVRVSAWRNLMERGFRGHLTGRVGKQLGSGCDSELCYALKLGAGRLRSTIRFGSITICPQPESIGPTCAETLPAALTERRRWMDISSRGKSRMRYERIGCGLQLPGSKICFDTTRLKFSVHVFA